MLNLQQNDLSNISISLMHNKKLLSQRIKESDLVVTNQRNILSDYRFYTRKQYPSIKHPNIMRKNAKSMTSFSQPKIPVNKEMLLRRQIDKMSEYFKYCKSITKLSFIQHSEAIGNKYVKSLKRALRYQKNCQVFQFILGTDYNINNLGFKYLTDIIRSFPRLKVLDINFSFLYRITDYGIRYLWRYMR